MINDIITSTNVNAVICALIAVRLLTFKRNGATHRYWGGFLAYALIVATASVSIRVFMGQYSTTTDISELVINIVLCIAVFSAKGNVVQLVKRLGGREANK
ncbi:phage holin family protein [Serratia fonticola]